MQPSYGGAAKRRRGAVGPVIPKLLVSVDVTGRVHEAKGLLWGWVFDLWLPPVVRTSKLTPKKPGWYARVAVWVFTRGLRLWSHLGKEMRHLRVDRERLVLDGEMGGSLRDPHVVQAEATT